MIVIGIYVSQLDLIPKGHPARSLALSQYPGGRPFIHNSENFNQSQEAF